ncbi:MAG: hypothetical protein U5K00_23385 [Melioribacteraceae bacterium]|nr:hypothetical protein [Melioribacteraceae bacterium]
MITFYERGINIGVVKDFQFHEGQPEIIHISNFGGFFSVRARKEPDIVTFQLPYFKFTSGIQELVDELGNVMEISLVNISSVDNVSDVKAYVQSIRRIRP